MSQARQTELQELENEVLTGYKGIINSDHAYIHRAIGYFATLDIGYLAAAASESYSFKTPANKYLHFKQAQLSGIGATVKLSMIRGTAANPLTIDSAGVDATELTGAHNANDNSSNVSGVVVKKTPTYVNNEDGEVWDYIKVLGTSTNQFESVSEESHGENFELVLKPDTYYVITFTNMSAGGGDAASNVSLRMFWYEQSDGIA